GGKHPSRLGRDGTSPPVHGCTGKVCNAKPRGRGKTGGIPGPLCPGGRIVNEHDERSGSTMSRTGTTLEAARSRRPIPKTMRAGVFREKRSEEHTSELQSRFDLVCRLLLEKKNRLEDMGSRCRRNCLSD